MELAVRLALETGMDGVVASPREVARVRSLAGSRLLVVTPGIRPSGSKADDQRRTATPEQALEGGADLLVVGRPITQARDPAAAARGLVEVIRKSLGLPAA